MLPRRVKSCLKHYYSKLGSNLGHRVLLHLTVEKNYFTAVKTDLICSVLIKSNDLFVF